MPVNIFLSCTHRNSASRSNKIDLFPITLLHTKQMRSALMQNCCKIQFSIAKKYKKYNRQFVSKIANDV